MTNPSVLPCSWHLRFIGPSDFKPYGRSINGSIDGQLYLYFSTIFTRNMPYASHHTNFICPRSAYADMRRSHGRPKTANWQRKWTDAKQKWWLVFTIVANVPNTIQYNAWQTFYAFDIICIIKEIFYLLLESVCKKDE